MADWELFWKQIEIEQDRETIGNSLIPTFFISTFYSIRAGGFQNTIIVGDMFFRIQKYSYKSRNILGGHYIRIYKSIHI